ncbi:MAG: RsmB/NOP family class I SAM-dependent RNA methyltransferase [Bacteroidetes bacterium]|nr:RsmB/NOP family class I SAM-dependent RNA methyltransferase [Bacteroidota bacterium]
MSSPSRAKTLIDHAAELARILLKTSQPPRVVTSTYLHQRKRMRTDEREFVSAIAFHALRNWRFIRASAFVDRGPVPLRPSPEESRVIISAGLLLSIQNFPPVFTLPAHSQLDSDIVDNAVREILFGWDSAAAERILRQATEIDAEATRMLEYGDETALPFDEEIDVRQAIALRWSLPDWVLRCWREQQRPCGVKDIARAAATLCSAAPLVLRVNTLRADRASLIDEMDAAGYTVLAHPLLAHAIILKERVALLDSHWYRDGAFEVQDAGSQLIGLACAVEPGWQVLDACAGGGGKAMQLANHMEDNGSIFAQDIERRKLRGLEQRARRLSLRSIRTGITAPGTESSMFDFVLVDAPCSGFGTVRRNPALKWRMREATVERLAVSQEKILARNARSVRPGGSLLYATCSLLPRENHIVMNRFLEAHPEFVPQSITSPLAPELRHALSHSPHAHDLLLFPDVLDSDGFFMARFGRT